MYLFKDKPSVYENNCTLFASTVWFFAVSASRIGYPNALSKRRKEIVVLWEYDQAGAD
jgi:hypothetical protein